MLFDVMVKKHYRHEPYHDVSGYELTIIRNDEPIPSWASTPDEYIQDEFERAVQVRETIAKALKEQEALRDIEKVNTNTIRVISWYSIGD